MKTPKQDVLNMVYGETEKQQKRYEHLSQVYTQTFGTSRMEFFTAPGRTEIIGNHVDHNGGKVLAASIDMDTIGAAYPNDSQTIEIVSEGYPDRIIIDLEQLDGIHAEGGVRFHWWLGWQRLSGSLVIGSADFRHMSQPM